jgi:hypothetical protein
MTSQQIADELLAEHWANRRNRMTSISNILGGIESKAAWIARDGQGLADYVAMLAVRRNFETLAEAAMDDAEKALLEALKTVRAARKAYQAKPLEQSHAA